MATKMYLSSLSEKECCGCGTCADICPRNCISIVPGQDGFLFPVVHTDVCVDCGRCRKVCPISEPVNLPTEHENSAWMFLASDPDYRKASASGGAFGKVAEAVAGNEDKIKIWGAAFDDGHKVKHICVDSAEDLDPIRGSKYLQSFTQGVFKEIAEQLRKGYFVVFSGTPCQVAALRKYLSLFKDVDMAHLLTTDLVCHGVPSQHMFDLYVEGAEKASSSKLVKAEFRFKETEPGEQPNSRRMRLSFEDGSSKIETRQNGAYLKMYHGGFGYRESCYHCPYARADRIGDLTLKDAWSVEEYYPEYDVHEGVSLVLSNSGAGDTWIEELRQRDDVVVLPVDYDVFMSKATGGALAKPTTRPARNQDLMECVEKIGFADAVERCCGPSFKQRVKRFAKRVLHQ